jgi:PIN domain nuclease of toxin-antitoxin system
LKLLLLDTHALLWWWTDDSRLSNAARQAIVDEGNQVMVSAASAWEIATKFRLGKLPHAAQALDRFNELVAADGFEHLPISYLHSLKAGSYASEHRDPFDRMLAAQTDLEKAVLVTLDPVFAGFQCRVLW